jgi:hypothetical protein
MIIYGIMKEKKLVRLAATLAELTAETIEAGARPVMVGLNEVPADAATYDSILQTEDGAFITWNPTESGKPETRFYWKRVIGQVDANGNLLPIEIPVFYAHHVKTYYGHRGKWIYQDFYRDPRSVLEHGAQLKPVALRVEIDPAGEYWGWISYEDPVGTLELIGYERAFIQICLPYGIEGSEMTFVGKTVRLKIEPVKQAETKPVERRNHAV